jgi:hypothetical protein
VNVVGLQIGKPAPKSGGDQDDPSKFGGIGRFGGFGISKPRPGTTLTLHLTLLNCYLVRLDEKASRIHMFTDDKSTELTETAANRPNWKFKFRSSIIRAPRRAYTRPRTQQAVGK